MKVNDILSEGFEYSELAWQIERAIKDTSVHFSKLDLKPVSFQPAGPKRIWVTNFGGPPQDSDEHMQLTIAFRQKQIIVTAIYHGRNIDPDLDISKMHSDPKVAAALKAKMKPKPPRLLKYALFLEKLCSAFIECGASKCEMMNDSGDFSIAPISAFSAAKFVATGDDTESSCRFIWTGVWE